MEYIDYFVLERIDDDCKGVLNSRNKDYVAQLGFKIPYSSIRHITVLERKLGTPIYFGESLSDPQKYHIISSGGWVIGKMSKKPQNISVDYFYELFVEQIVNHPDLLDHIPTCYFEKNKELGKKILENCIDLEKKEKLEKKIKAINDRIKSHNNKAVNNNHVSKKPNIFQKLFQSKGGEIKHNKSENKDDGKSL